MISNDFKKRIFTSIVLLGLTLLMFKFNLWLAYCLIVLGVLSILEFLNIMKKITNKKFFLFISNSFFSIYVFIFCFIFFFFSQFIQLKIILFTLLLGCIGSDIGGLIFGKVLKGPKLTQISPNKTIAGSFGSIILTCLLISSSMVYFTKNFSYTLLIIAAITSVACQFGDLFFSFLKRKAKIKDTGNFLPGHGGILDRLDGIFLGLPLGYISLILFY